jgi:hypothetical protein
MVTVLFERRLRAKTSIIMVLVKWLLRLAVEWQAVGCIASMAIV